jgi:aminoglycoside 2''-phosphotransferase
VPVIDPSAWRHQYERHYRWLRDEAFRLLSVFARVYTERLYEDFLSDESNFGFKPVLVHGDLGCEHILCDQRSGRIVGIIDWGEVMVGDPTDDFAAIKVGLGGDLVSAVASSYAGASDAAFWRRVEWYTRVFRYYDIIHGLKTGLKTALEAGVRSVNSAAAGQP